MPKLKQHGALVLGVAIFALLWVVDAVKAWMGLELGLLAGSVLAGFIAWLVAVVLGRLGFAPFAKS